MRFDLHWLGFDDWGEVRTHFTNYISRASLLVDEETGESEILPDMVFSLYRRPQMILVDHDFCQRK